MWWKPPTFEAVRIINRHLLPLLLLDENLPRLVVQAEIERVTRGR
jgi:cell pole-organizing protein PopZ